MSRIHVSFVKREQTPEFVIYRVISPDFPDEQLIGELRIDLLGRQYEFTPMGTFFGKSVVPTHVFDLPEQSQDQVISQEFPDYAYGGWTSRIAKMAKRLMESGDYPNEVFGVT